MTADLRQHLDASLGQTFTITRELGGGGMSRVFVATDRSLDRQVVIKVLSDEFTGSVNAERFRREIQLIAKLQHPHVVPLLSAGSAGETLYYVMPFRDGETLRARMARDGRLSINDTVRILREVLDALAFAHEHGVVHRDIKPENILLESGHAVVADFGISKALRESTALTSIGVSLGTPTYMAPEQASADPDTDHRADLYAVGIVAYEMLAGAPPFSGSPQQVFRAHMVDEPQWITARRSDVPEPLASIVMRALAKEPSARPASAREMLAALEALGTPTPRPAAAPVRGRARTVAMAVGAAAVLLASAAAWQFTRPAVIASAQSIAIAPFAVATGDTSLVRLGQYLVSTISASVDGVGDIRVADPMAVLSHARSKGHLLSGADAAGIARTLGASSVLSGTLVSLGTTVRADAILSESGSGNVLARFSVIAPADSLTVISDSLTWGVLRSIWSRGRAPTPNFASITTRSPLALREFLAGEALFARGDAIAAAESYKRAAETDTNFLFAHMRYRTARGWWLMSQDSTIVNRLERNAARLPVRDREWLSAFDGVETTSDRISATRAYLSRFPDYLPARVYQADYLLHHAMRAGYDVRNAVPLWRDIVSTVPGDIDMAGHLVWACMSAGDLPCAQSGFAHFDSLVRSDSVPSFAALWAHRSFLTLLSPDPERVIDSLARAQSPADSVIPLDHHHIIHQTAGVAAAIPDFGARFERVMQAYRPIAERFHGVAGARYIRAMARVARGDWSAIDTAITLAEDARLAGVYEVSSMEAARGRAIAEALGLIAPSPRTAQLGLARAGSRDATGGQRQDGRWMAAMSAHLRGDSAGYAARLREIAADSGEHSRIALRSLRALALGRSGNRAAAAESLLALERDHGERATKVYSAYAVDRMMAAQWLSETGRYAEADSLLQFAQGWSLAANGEIASPVFALAQLQRSRIAESMGKREDAVMFASTFVNIWDLAPESQQPLIAEAKQRIARLTSPDARR